MIGAFNTMGNGRKKFSRRRDSDPHLYDHVSVHTGCEGYVTVIFAMILLTVISVILSSIEAVRISSVRMRTEAACAIASEAFLSQFQPQVQARYGLFLLERDGYDDAFLKQFIEKNCNSSDSQSTGIHWTDASLSSVAIIDERKLSSDDFKYFEAQICDYMKITTGAQYAQAALNKLTGFSSQNLDQQKDRLSTQLTTTGSSSDRQKAEAEAAAKDDPGSDANKQTSQSGTQPPQVKDPRKNITQLLRYPILTLLMDGNLSTATLDMSSLSEITASEKNVSQISGFLQYRDVSDNLKGSGLGLVDQISSKGQELLVDSYILDYLKNASTPEKKSGTCFKKDDATGTYGTSASEGLSRCEINGSSALQYEVEYILSGNAKDARNLENTVNRLALIRMLLNLSYLYGDQANTAAVRSVATALAAALLMPFLEEIFYILILAAWAYGEALIDCRHLLEGGKVPLMKDASTWNLSLNQLTQLQSTQVSNGSDGGDNQKGLSYEDYLRLLLLGVSREKKYIRLMNIIEANIHLESGCESFSMGQCVLGITLCADFEFFPIFAANPFSSGRYEHHVLKSAAY